MEGKGASRLFYRHALKPKELALVIPNVNECLFALHTKLTARDYEVIVYKYGEEYFVLDDVRIFKQIHGMEQESQGDEEEILPYVEEAFEDNCYTVVEEELVKLELNTLSIISNNCSVQVRYYEFTDFL